MYDFTLKTPVAFIIFKRPDTTEKVFEAIRQAKPPKLLVIADGARVDKPGEAEKCAAARAIIDRVDWDCEVLKNYSDVNMGCKLRVSSGLDWVFDTVEEAIILEDDCLPHMTFFRFCEELLNLYRHDERIMSISGTNDQVLNKRTEYSYYFSIYNRCWGWASWRRAWNYYDLDMKLWPEIRDQNFLEYLLDDNAAKFWTNTFQNVYEGRLNTWAYRWKFACWIQSGLSIIPNVNLVKNIGFGEEATNTKKNNKKHAMTSLESMIFPMDNPQFMIRDLQLDKAVQKNVYNKSLLIQAKSKIKKILNL